MKKIKNVHNEEHKMIGKKKQITEREQFDSNDSPVLRAADD